MADLIFLNVGRAVRTKSLSALRMPVLNAGHQVRSICRSALQASTQMRKSIVVKKSKAQGDSQLATTVRKSANQIFLAGLGAFNKAQHEGTKVFDALVKEGTNVFDGLVEEGTAVRKRATGLADSKMAEMKAADEQAKKQAQDLGKQQLADQQQKDSHTVNSGNFTFEGSWYDASTPKQYFAGGKDEPDCDFVIKKSGGHWSIANHCSHLKRSIDRVEVQAGQLSFRLTGHDPAFPYSEVDVTFTLSPDGQKMDGRGTYYDKDNFAAGYYSVLWVRR